MACTCLCDKCSDKIIIKTLTDSILQIQQHNNLGGLATSPRTFDQNEPNYAQVDVQLESKREIDLNCVFSVLCGGLRGRVIALSRLS